MNIFLREISHYISHNVQGGGQNQLIPTYTPSDGLERIGEVKICHYIGIWKELSSSTS